MCYKYYSIPYCPMFIRRFVKKTNFKTIKLLNVMLMPEMETNYNTPSTAQSTNWCHGQPKTSKTITLTFIVLLTNHSIPTTQYIRTLSIPVHCKIYTLCFIPVYTKPVYYPWLIGLDLLSWSCSGFQDFVYAQSSSCCLFIAWSLLVFRLCSCLTVWIFLNVCLICHLTLKTIAK